jgi:drug/metabolite transporter (DMT)-like permease
VIARVAANAENGINGKKSLLTGSYQRWIADGLLLLISLIWGSTFAIAKEVLASVDSVALIGMRFLVASVIATLIVAPRIGKVDRKAVRAGVIIGLILFSGYVFQTIGLEYTTASKCGFITGLSVVLVPVFSALLLRRSPDTASVIGVVFATIGLALLSLDFSEAVTIQIGDFLSLLGAIAFGFQIVTVGKFAPMYDVHILVLIQLWTVAIAALGVVGHTLLFSPSGLDIALIGFLGVFATALTLFVQNFAQKFADPTHVAIIFATEPVFAGLFGWWLLGETLAGIQLTGAALIIVGMLIAEICC